MVLADFKGHKDSVTCCALSASGKLVASSSEDHTVKVIDLHVYIPMILFLQYTTCTCICICWITYMYMLKYMYMLHVWGTPTCTCSS
jgi:hypothetical protein